MQFSESTLKYLKNLAAVNPCVYLRAGAFQRSSAPGIQNIHEVTLEQELPCDFPIYALNEFLNLLNVMTVPEIEFASNKMVIKDSEGYTLTYMASSKKIIAPVEDDQMALLESMPFTLAFDISRAIMDKMLNLARLGGLSHIAVVESADDISLEAYNKGVDTSNRVSIKLITKDEKSTPTNGLMHFVIAHAYMNVAVDDYQVAISENGFAKFQSKTGPYRYFIAGEKE